MMIIRKIDIVNVQLVKGNFATRKHNHIKLSTCKYYHLTLSTPRKKFATHNFIFNSQNKFTTRKTTLQLLKSTLQLVNLFS